MRQPHEEERQPGRSFNDPSRPLGEELLRRSATNTAPTKENFKSRVTQAAEQAASDRFGVGERAKVIGVLRKAEEFMSTANPPADTEAHVRRALELACGRMGLTYGEYRAYTDGDPELVELERRVILDARRRCGGAAAPSPSPPREPVAAPVDEREAIGTVTLFDRVFVPIDYTMSSHRALGVALELKRTHGSAICLFHAAESSGSDDWLGGIGSPSVGGDWVTDAEDRLRRFLTNIAPDAGADIEVRSIVGNQLDVISQEAHRWGATLVVTTADMHARLLRSPAERLVRELDLPVLLIPAGQAS